MYKVNKFLIALGVILSLFISRYAKADRVDKVKAFERGTVYVNTVPNEIDYDEALEAAESDKLTWKCTELEAIDGKIKNISGTATYTTGKITGHRSKYLARKAATNGTVYKCESQRHDKHTDTLKKRG